MKKLFFGLFLMSMVGVIQARFFHGQCYEKQMGSGEGARRMRIYLLHDTHVGTEGVLQQNALIQKIAEKHAFAIIEDRFSLVLINQALNASGLSEDMVLSDAQKDQISAQFLHASEQVGSPEQLQLATQFLSYRLATPLALLDFYLRRARLGGARFDFENIECRTAAMVGETAHPTCRQVLDNINKAREVLVELRGMTKEQSQTHVKIDRYFRDVIDPLYHVFGEACIRKPTMALNELYASGIIQEVCHLDLEGFFNPIMQSLTDNYVAMGVCLLFEGDRLEERISQCLVACFFPAVDFNIMKSIQAHRIAYDNFVVCAGSAHVLSIGFQLEESGFRKIFEQGSVDPRVVVQGLGVIGEAAQGAMPILPNALDVNLFFNSCPE